MAAASGSSALYAAHTSAASPCIFTRDVYKRQVLDGTGLTWSMVWICGLCAVIALAVGLFVFRRQQDKFVLHI